MDLDRILTSVPVNRSAASVVSWRRVAIPAGELTRDELIALNTRLERKLRLLKQVLRITSKAQHVNLLNAIKSGRRNKPGVGMLRLTANPRTALEYKRVGEEMQRMQTRLAELRAEARAAHKTPARGVRATSSASAESVTARSASAVPTTNGDPE